MSCLIADIPTINTLCRVRDWMWGARRPIAQRNLPMKFPKIIFRSEPSSVLYLPEIDGLRSLAILAVVLFHSSGYFYVKNLERGMYTATESAGDELIRWVLSHGFLGVQLFFAISGFVLALPFARRARAGESPPDYRSYILRRVTRIEPPYVIALCFYAAASLFLAPESFRPIQYMAGLCYARNAFFDDGTWLFYVSWSLEIEIQFYLIAPLLSLIFRLTSPILRRGTLAVAIVAAGFYAATYRLSGVEPMPLGGPLQHGWWLGPELAFFLIGMLVADITSTVHSKSSDKLVSFCWDVAWVAGLLLVLSSYRMLEHSAAGITALLVGLFLVMLGTLQSKWVRGALARPIPSMVGGACYTIYLFHPLPLAFCGKLLLPLTGNRYGWDMVLVAIPMGIAVTLSLLLLFPLVERPFMNRHWPQELVLAIRERALGRVIRLIRGQDQAIANRPTASR